MSNNVIANSGVLIHPRMVAVGSGKISDELVGTAKSLYQRFQVWQVNRAARAELNSLSQRELDDIGISRGDLDRVFSR